MAIKIYDKYTFFFKKKVGYEWDYCNGTTKKKKEKQPPFKDRTLVLLVMKHGKSYHVAMSTQTGMCTENELDLKNKYVTTNENMVKMFSSRDPDMRAMFKSIVIKDMIRRQEAMPEDACEPCIEGIKVYKHE
jgi:hypothetical protein